MLTPVGDSTALAEALSRLLGDPSRRAALSAEGSRRVAMFDWSVVAGQVLRVYEAAIAADPRHVSEAL